MFSTPAFAQAAGGATAAGPGAFIQFVPIVLMVVIFYFLLIRPQQSRARQHRQMLDALKKGDTVVTGGGLIGRVIRVDEAEAEIEVAQGTRVRVVKATLAEVRLPMAKPAND